MPTLDLLDHPLISQRYFFPIHESFSGPWWVEADGARLACARFDPCPGGRTLVHFHGNGEVVADYLGDFPNLVAQLGCNLLLVEYRGYGMSSGEPQLGRMLEDVDPVIDALGQSEERLVFFGRSVGSIFALRAASRFPGAAGLVLESGVADVAERLLLRIAPEELGVSRHDLIRSIQQRCDHRSSLERFRGKTLVMHCEHDGLVDVSHAHRLHAWAGVGSELLIFPQGDHNSIFAVNAAAYVAALDRLLRKLG